MAMLELRWQGNGIARITHATDVLASDQKAVALRRALNHTGNAAARVILPASTTLTKYLSWRRFITPLRDPSISQFSMLEAFLGFRPPDRIRSRAARTPTRGLCPLRGRFPTWPDDHQGHLQVSLFLQRTQPFLCTWMAHFVRPLIPVAGALRAADHAEYAERP